MCGVIGINSDKVVKDRIVLALQRLEYRGYDSAGVALIDKGTIETIKVKGKIEALRLNALESKVDGNIGIGHTRWATHGVPSTANAHPHSTDSVSIVHNGIIENHMQIKAELLKKGVKFQSDTDSEIIVHLLEQYINSGLDFASAVRSMLNELEGAYAIIAISSKYPDIMIATKKGSPLAVSCDGTESFVGSDGYSLAKFAKHVQYLEDKDIAVCKKGSIEIYDASAKLIQRESIAIADAEASDKGQFQHYMQKEIFEQPASINRSLEHYLNNPIKLDLKSFKRIYIIACGTSLYAGMIAKYWIQEFTGVPVEVEISSEFRYGSTIVVDGSLGIFISQSGETADTLECLKLFKKSKQKTIGIVNVLESAIARGVDYVLPIMAGQEIGVASTKAFSSQLIVLAMLALQSAHGPTDKYSDALQTLPGRVADLLNRDAELQSIASIIAHTQSIFYVGRGIAYPIALEGALKLKELSYIHAEALAAGELKHGPIALVDENTYVIAVVPYNKIFSKCASNLQTLASRGAKIILFSNTQGCRELVGISHKQFIISEEADVDLSDIISPLIYTVPMQLIAYHVTVIKALNVDQPRNLAKSVTVE